MGMNLRLIAALGLVTVLVATSCSEGKPTPSVESGMPPAVLRLAGSVDLELPPPEKTRRERLATPDPDYRSIAHAVRVIQRRFNFPVLIPGGLEGWRLGPRHAIHFSRDLVQLDLRKGRKKILIVLFGRVGFDGCGGDNARPVMIDGKPGLVNPSSGGHVWSEVIWPATPKHPEGRYGLTGTFGAKAIVKLARTMERAVAAMSTKQPRGC